MEISPNSDTKLPVRRRLIQSTLIPHKPQDNAVSVDEDLEPDVDQEDDDEEYCGSQSRVRKNKKRKPKLVSQSRVSTKVAVNGNETGAKNTEEEDSPATVKCDFFLKVSERRQLQKQKKEQLSTHSPDKNDQNQDLELDINQEDDEDEEYSLSQSQAKKNKKRKPKAVSQSRPSRKLAVNKNEIEVKNAEEEDSPATVKCDFFLKVSERRNQRRPKKEHTPVKIEQSCSPSDAIANSKTPRKTRRRASSTPKKQTPSKNGVINGNNLVEDLLTSPPKQIPDLRLEAKMTAEENKRIFAGKQIHPFFSSSKTIKKNTETTGLENKWSHFEGKGENNNDFTPFHIFEKTQGETFFVDWRNWMFSESIFTRTSEDPCCLQLINEGSVNCLQFDNFLDTPPLDTSCQNKGYSSKSPILLEETSLMPPIYHDCHNSLWTTKYQPEKPIQICGNNESVKFVNEWLRLWHEKGSRNNNKCCTDINDNWIMQGVDLNYSPTDSDSESNDEETSLKNVLLVTGPVGSGKSAAIYACAKEQGFQVIEVNTSDWRNGALVKQKFGEAVESHWLNCSVPNSENPDNKNQLKSSDDGVELIQLSDDEDSKNLNENKINGIKTLILFEDIDATLYEDRGFISTIQQLAETAKRPMILTCNSDDPDLPNNLDRIEVSFKIPSSDDLLTLAKTVCAEEKAEINPCLVERFIDYCEGDIRKTIMLLQFWCQGQNRKKLPDFEARNSYAPLLFDTNAGHHVLPQIMPPGHTSKLSEIIENEIAKSILLAEKYYYNNIVLDTIEEEEENIDAKKDEMLRRHCSDQDESKFMITSCSSSPVAFTKRRLQKKHEAGIGIGIGMSDSGDGLNGGLPEMDLDLDEVEEVVVEKRLRRKYNSVLSSDSEEDCADVSCVPESSYVVETELGNGICSDGGEITSRTVTTMEFNDSFEEDKVPVSNSGLESAPVPVHREEIGDSNVEPPMVGVVREYQMMDECSRIDFNKKPEPESESPESESPDIVQETWRKLRNCEHEFKQYYVPNEEKETLEALQISHGITDLISETDLLLSDCQLLTCDYLKPSMVSPEKPHSSSWHEDQLQMGSTIGQHGFCLYAKRGSKSNSKSNGQFNLGQEMLAASTNAGSLGKLINQNNTQKKIGVSSKSILESPVCNTVRSIVPLKSQLSLKGYIFHEYLSTLSQISTSESSRFSEAINTSNQRRKRVARNYLSNGGLSLSSEDILLLEQYSCYHLKQKKLV